MAKFIGLVCVATAGTGTDKRPSPFDPFTCTRTCQDPCDIIHSDPVKNCGSSFDRCIKSGVGANFAAGPVIGVGVMRISETYGDEQRISISATPGITVGGRTVTKIR
jgi:hypothetical protein